MILTDEYIEGLRQECNGASYLSFARAIEQAILAKMNSAEPVYYEYRTWYGENTVKPGWGEWVRVTPRNALCTMEDAVNEIDHYIGAGYKYQLRGLYEHQPAPSAVNVTLTGEGKTNQLADFIHRFKRHVGGDGEFWLHELEDFYFGEVSAARSEK